jgi:hypothetical protein
MSKLIHSLSSAKALAELSNSVKNAKAAARPGALQESRPPMNESLGRPDSLTAKSVEVSLVLNAMLGESAASAYLARHAVDEKIAQRVLSESGKRRSSYGADGIIS